MPKTRSKTPAIRLSLEGTAVAIFTLVETEYSEDAPGTYADPLALANDLWNTEAGLVDDYVPFVEMWLGAEHGFPNTADTPAQLAKYLMTVALEGEGAQTSTAVATVDESAHIFVTYL